MTVLFILLILLLTGLIYACMFMLDQIISKLQSRSPAPGRHRKIKWLIFSALLSATLVAFYLLNSGPSNYKTAHLERVSQGYQLKLKGRRALMTHDLFSIIEQKTYEDSALFILPRNEGVISASEMVEQGKGYPCNGSLSIQGISLRVELTINNTDDKKQMPSSWNGEYELKRKEN